MNQFYKIDEDALQKGALEELKKRVNSLELVLDKNATSIPYLFKSITNFVKANETARETKVNEFASPYFEEYNSCMRKMETVIQKKFGKGLILCGEW